MSEVETVQAVINLLKNKLEIISGLWADSDDQSDFEKGLYTGKMQTIAVTIGQLEKGDLRLFKGVETDVS